MDSWTRITTSSCFNCTFRVAISRTRCCSILIDLKEKKILKYILFSTRVTNKKICKFVRSYFFLHVHKKCQSRFMSIKIQQSNCEIPFVVRTQNYTTHIHIYLIMYFLIAGYFIYFLPPEHHPNQEGSSLLFSFSLSNSCSSFILMLAIIA